MRRTPIWLLTLALAFGGCDCGDDDSPGGTDAGPGDSGPAGDAARNVCGDGIARMGELCDDGNTEDGDGCSADCTSDESCGNSALDLAAGELCDDGNADDGDGCRGDCLSDYRCGNGVLDVVADGAPADEVCDDGNTVNGDGCNATCDSDETCGNSVVDLGAGEVCDDGNTDDGDDCSADCMTSLLCGNGEVDAGEDCDDGNTTAGDGCDAACHVEVCGNGTVDAGEDCDDGNDVDADGCETDCTFTCSADADCDDANDCSGTETCTDPGTATSACAAGTALADGAACGSGGVCNGGVCTTAGCGDGIVSGTEQCDDMNTTAGDGCENDCTWTCETGADCSDGNACNGTETCTMGGTLMSRCGAGTPLADGAVCDRDMMASTRDICRTMMCRASTCGDTFVDTGATPPEQCDDGNTASGDGCSSTCQTETITPTGFRVTNLDLISPRVSAQVLFFCVDGTQTSPTGDSVNSALDTAIADYSLNVVNLFRPLNIAAATSPAELHLNADCMAGTPRDSCGPAAMMPSVVMSTANNRSTGTCYVPVAADVNTRAGTPAAYSPTANTVSAPCFVTDEEEVTISLAGIDLTLHRARVAATYSGSPTNRLVTGVVTGFMTDVETADLVLPATIADGMFAGDRLYEHLQAGNMPVVASDGTTVNDGCNVGGSASENDADMDPTLGRGFWFFLNFEAEVIDWTGT